MTEAGAAEELGVSAHRRRGRSDRSSLVYALDRVGREVLEVGW